MPKISYQTIRIGEANRAIIDHANRILREYATQGYDLTLRQLYYQFVGRGLFDQLGFKADRSGSTNNPQSYKRLGSIINDARLCGLIDWNHIEDRTRNLHRLSSWQSPADIVRACANQYRTDPWLTQPYYVECWVEKEALAGVFERVCDENRVPVFCCRGYTSQSEMWSAGRRMMERRKAGKKIRVLHFGDHDPSGVDMTRDVADRLSMFAEGTIEVVRLALNMDQVEEYSPPPNPAKITDSRAEGYIREYGEESWELDALEPATLAQLVTDAIADVRDDTRWEDAMGDEQDGKGRLSAIADELEGEARDDEE